MGSVANELRELRLKQVQALSAGDRVALALELGEFDADSLAKARGIDRDAAIRELRRNRQVGRRRSRCASEPAE